MGPARGGDRSSVGYFAGAGRGATSCGIRPFRRRLEGRSRSSCRKTTMKRLCREDGLKPYACCCLERIHQLWIGHFFSPLVRRRARRTCQVSPASSKRFVARKGSVVLRQGG